MKAEGKKEEHSLCSHVCGNLAYEQSYVQMDFPEVENEYIHCNLYRLFLDSIPLH